MRSRRAIMIGFALATTLLIPVDVAQLAPAAAVSQAGQTAAAPVADLPFSHVLYGKGAMPQVPEVSNTHGCPRGYACMYTEAGWDTNTPEHEYYYYNCYNLSNEYGTRYIYNNQYSGGDISGFGLSGCGGGVQWTFAPGGFGPVNITPVNSVKVYQ